MADLPISDTVYDLVIVAGSMVAGSRAMRRLSVYLCEKDDLASGTSSRSTKLVPGGLR